jgi:hypothetical protein
VPASNMLLRIPWYFIIMSSLDAYPSTQARAVVSERELRQTTLLAGSKGSCRLHGISPDDSQTNANIRAFPALLQD